MHDLTFAESESLFPGGMRNADDRPAAGAAGGGGPRPRRRRNGRRYRNALNEAGLSLNLRLIRSAALVHDMARGSVDHAGQGANLLRSLDMHKMAEIVENHMEIAWSEGQQIHEAEVVFLADKLVQEDRYVGLGERFRRRMNDFCVDSQAHAGIRRRIGTARKIAEQIEAVTGRTLESLQCQKPAVRSAR